MVFKATSPKPLTILSLMSGTSADGIDAVLACFELQDDQKETLRWHVIDRLSLAYEPGLRERILACLKPESSNVLLLTEVHAEVGQAYADLVKRMQAEHTFDVVALSGQTVYHIPRVDPAMNWRTLSTLQLGEAAVVTESCGVPVVSDFRQGDMAAGGQGAPMVSFGDYMMFSEPGRARTVHNLGGISNLTHLPADGNPEQVFAFDTGPANCLIDEAVKGNYGLEFDAEGRIAASGSGSRADVREAHAPPLLDLTLTQNDGAGDLHAERVDFVLDRRPTCGRPRRNADGVHRALCRRGLPHLSQKQGVRRNHRGGGRGFESGLDTALTRAIECPN